MLEKFQWLHRRQPGLRHAELLLNILPWLRFPFTDYIINLLLMIRFNHRLFQQFFNLFFSNLPVFYLWMPILDNKNG